MNVEFVCHACGRELKAGERSIGRRARCPECGTLLVIPDPAAGVEALEEKPAAVENVENAEKPAEESVRAYEDASVAEPPPIVAPPKQKPTLLPPKVIARARRSVEEDAPLLPRHRPHPEDLIDMTAMVDIVFFLLIFFLVTSLQALEAVMNMPTPQAAEGGVATGRSVADLENDPNFITVRIEDDDSIWVEDTQVFNDQELTLRLRAARKESDGPRSLLVVGDADASHGAAVRVFDAGSGAGVTGISLIVQEKSEAAK